MPKKLGPMNSGDPSIGHPCHACGKAFMDGDYTTMVVLGPGEDPTEQVKCRQGLTYNAVAVEVHWECATGELP